MKRLIDYVEEFKKRLNIESDYECAKVLGVNRQQIHKIRMGATGIGREKIVRIAMGLKINPMEIISIVEADKEKNPEVKAIWVKLHKETIKENTPKKEAQEDREESGKMMKKAANKS